MLKVKKWQNTEEKKELLFWIFCYASHYAKYLPYYSILRSFKERKGIAKMFLYGNGCSRFFNVCFGLILTWRRFQIQTLCWQGIVHHLLLLEYKGLFERVVIIFHGGKNWSTFLRGFSEVSNIVQATRSDLDPPSYTQNDYASSLCASP